jgi:glycosyltransferase involved in cell wall biosynthesis
MPETSRDPGAAAYEYLALAVADINWFTTESLFREIDQPSVSILALRCLDYLNGWRRGIYPWSRSCRPHPWGNNSLTRDLVLPSGWMKRFPRLGMRPIAGAVRGFWNQADPRARRGLVLTYPHYLYLRDQLGPDVTLYYNIDDYTLYWPRHAAQVQWLERQMVLRADATICVARYRADELRAAVPEAAEKIHHLPHGTPAAFLADEPRHRPAPAPEDIAHLPRPLLGYVGSIGRRLDWPLMKRLSEAFPQASVVVVGEPPLEGHQREPWFMDWAAEFSSRPNVHTIGWRPQAELPRYYQAFDVILIPYAQDHPFNRACSPTKIMDGLGSGRPIVATAIPECRLYSHLFDVARDTGEFVDAVRSIVAAGSDDGRACLRHTHAREHTCRIVADRVLGLLQNRQPASGLVENPAPG